MGVVMLGRVIIGDIAATLTDLAIRRLLEVDEEDGAQPGWLLSPQHKRAPSYRLETLLHYERVLLELMGRIRKRARRSSTDRQRQLRIRPLRLHNAELAVTFQPLLDALDVGGDEFSLGAGGQYQRSCLVAALSAQSQDRVGHHG
jgi:hypothetical protein